MDINKKLIESIMARNDKEVKKYTSGGFLSKPANINYQNESGSTPLHFAARFCDSNLVEYLIEKGAGIDAINQYGETPLHWAAKRHNNSDSAIEVIKLLISKGADMNIKSRNIPTPLSCALMNPDRRVARIMRDSYTEYLICHDVDANTRLENGETPLFFAEDEKLIDILIAKGADVNARDHYGNTPLFATSDPKKISLLLNHGANPNARNNWDYTPLFSAADNPESISLLLNHGADPNVRNNEGNTVLSDIMLRPERAVKAVIECLLLKGADANIPNKNGSTPLINLIRLHDGHDADKTREIAWLLLAHGADINARNIMGKTADYYLEGHLHKDIAMINVLTPSCHEIILQIISSTKYDICLNINKLLVRGPEFAPCLAESLEDERIFLSFFRCVVWEESVVMGNYPWVTETIRKRYNALPLAVKQKEFYKASLGIDGTDAIKQLYIVRDFSNLEELISGKKTLESIMDNEDCSHGGLTMWQVYSGVIDWIDKLEKRSREGEKG